VSPWLLWNLAAVVDLDSNASSASTCARALHTRGDVGGGRQAAYGAARGKYYVLNTLIRQVKFWATWTWKAVLTRIRSHDILFAQHRRKAQGSRGLLVWVRAGLVPFLSPVSMHPAIRCPNPGFPLPLPSSLRLLPPSSLVYNESTLT
jgi:hypothetical protein